MDENESSVGKKFVELKDQTVEFGKKYGAWIAGAVAAVAVAAVAYVTIKSGEDDEYVEFLDETPTQES